MANFFAKVASFTSGFQQGITFLLLFATTSRYRSQTRVADEMTSAHYIRGCSKSFWYCWFHNNDQFRQL